MPKTGGIERAEMVLEAYGGDDRDRLFRLLTDLGEHAAYLGYNFPSVAVSAWEAVKERNNSSKFCRGCRCWHAGPRCQGFSEEALDDEVEV